MKEHKTYSKIIEIIKLVYILWKYMKKQIQHKSKNKGIQIVNTMSTINQNMENQVNKVECLNYKFNDKFYCALIYFT